MKPWTLDGKKTLITGGTKGIGRAIVNDFAALKADVFLIARNQQEVTALIEAIKADGGQADGAAGDLSDGKFRQLLVDKISSKWSSLDVLVNNVGTNIRRRLVDYSEEEYRKLFETNLFSAIEMSRMCFPLLKASGNASVVNIASIAGSLDVMTGAPYGMTKAALIQLSRHLAAEWAPHKIRVNAISPWYIDTPLTSPLLSQPERMSQIIARTPLNRIGYPDEVSGVVAFLAMDHCSYVTGQNIIIDGGMSIKGL